MAKVTAQAQREFKLVPAGSHAAVCNLVAHMGLQNTTYLGKPKIQPKVYIRFQIPSERVEWEKDGVKQEGPMSIGSTYTESLSEKANLRKVLESWRSRAFTNEELYGFELFDIIGKPCLLSIVHDKWEDGSTHASIAGISAMPKGMTAPKLEGDLLRYDDQHTEQFNDLPEWLQKKIKEQVKPQPQAPVAASTGVEFQDDDIPF